MLLASSDASSSVPALLSASSVVVASTRDQEGKEELVISVEFKRKFVFTLGALAGTLVVY